MEFIKALLKLSTKI